MMHLTQIKLDVPTAARLQIRDVYDWHQRVWQCFPGRDGRQRDFLTRLDRQSEGFRLLVVSPAEPVRPSWCPTTYESWKVKLIPDKYLRCHQYAFQLRANPTKKVAAQNTDGTFKKNGRREPLRKREDLVLWINRKGQEGGFLVDEKTLCTFSQGREYFDKNGMRGLHSAVEFQGRLTVNSPKAFYDVFRHGIGPAKAFGFGLLVIAPVS